MRTQSRKELETHILINQADRDDGYFTVYTSHRPHYDKLCKRVGKANFVSLREIKESGRVVAWDIKIPYAYLSPASFGVRILGRSPVKRTLNATQKEALARGRRERSSNGKAG